MHPLVVRWPLARHGLTPGSPERPHQRRARTAPGRLLCRGRPGQHRSGRRPPVADRAPASGPSFRRPPGRPSSGAVQAHPAGAKAGKEAPFAGWRAGQEGGGSQCVGGPVPAELGGGLCRPSPRASMAARGCTRCDTGRAWPGGGCSQGTTGLERAAFRGSGLQANPNLAALGVVIAGLPPSLVAVTSPASVPGSEDPGFQIRAIPLGGPLTGHTDGIESVAWARAGDRLILATGSTDATGRLWELADPAPGQPPPAPRPLGEPLTGHTGFGDTMAVC
jgi:hypothetical protein